MNNEQEKIEFFKFNKPGVSIEGRLISMVQVKTGAAVLIETAKKEKFKIGVSTIGQKRVFKAAALAGCLISDHTIIDLTFIEEIPLKDSNNVFMHFELKGLKDSNDKKSLFSFTSKEFQEITQDHFLSMVE